MSRRLLAVFGLALAAACADGDGDDAATADSLNRDLQLAPADSSVALNDAPATSTTPEPAAPAPSTSRPSTSRPAPSPSRPSTSAPAPAAPAARTLPAGTELSATVGTEISSKTHKQGQTVTARVARDVRDAQGRVVIPAGSTVNLTITSIRESENKSDNTGTLTLAASSVEINGTTHDLTGNVTGLATELRDRPTDVGDVAKVGGGAAAGAVVGRVLGGGSKGAIIGGVIGGAVGAQRANETQDRDVILPAGSTVVVTLDNTFTRTTT
ncbi:MAG TPA: glycine zipper domain-containing protein [Gemmatimonadales bacterium]|nr:glycine zipper domain-containing protein [Gemmatimonadales bacterium]